LKNTIFQSANIKMTKLDGKTGIIYDSF